MQDETPVEYEARMYAVREEAYNAFVTGQALEDMFLWEQNMKRSWLDRSLIDGLTARVTRNKIGPSYLS